MGVVGKTANPRANRSVNSQAEAESAAQTAAYVEEICAGLAVMAKKADLVFLAHLLALAQAEANDRAGPQPPDKASRRTT